MRPLDVALNRLVNPMVVALLRSPLHRMLSRSVVVVETRGRRTGRIRRTPANFRRDGDVLILRSVPRRRWWRNLTAQPVVKVWLDGHAVSASADVSIDATSVQIRLTPIDEREPAPATDSVPEAVVEPDGAPSPRP